MKTSSCAETGPGTSQDYTADLYWVYFEVGEYQNQARNIIESYLDDARRQRLQVLPYGYLAAIPIQVTPEIVRKLVAANIAVYQVRRCARDAP